jgi:DNA-binding CsgD family transcriptional regulator
MYHPRRLANWLDLVAAILEHPRSRVPAQDLARQFGQTFDVASVSWEWRTGPTSIGYVTYSGLGEAIAYPSEWHEVGVLSRHPLVRWYSTTRSLAPQTIGRVPTDVAPTREREFVAELLGLFNADQEMSIPYDVGSTNYGAFVLGRPTEDFSDEDLELAGDLRPLLRALHRRTGADAVNQELRTARAHEAGLTATELAVLALLAEGHTAYGIGARLSMAPGTASKHAGHLYRKLGVNDRLSAVLVAQEIGLVDPPPDAQHSDES